MSKNSVQSKTFAVIVVILAIAAVWSLVGMTVYFEIRKDTLNMTPPATAPSTTLAPPPDRRLRGDVLPEYYTIFIKVYVYPRFIEEVNVTTPNQTLYFDGNVTIDFHCVQQTKSIFLHSRHQKISTPAVRNRTSGEYLKVEGYRLQNEDDFLEIRLKEKLEVGGNYSLFLEFSADVNENLDGLFLSTYREGMPDSEDDPYAVRYLVATNMEPTSARTVFPCFDEPAMKAIFKLTVIHRKDTTALANQMTEGPTLCQPGWLCTQFEPTPVMSTYLFAFTVSEFTGKTHPPHKITIYARPEAIKAGHADVAVKITVEILDFYDAQFGSDLAYKQKLDQIALPDLGPAAMENWGLVTYQEGVLLYEPDVSSELQEEVIAFMIAHELAHQWFGNLVTMKWWNEVWLNEGFATYMSSLAVDDKLPNLNVMEMVIANELQSALEADALASSHPLSPPASEVQTTDEIMELFDLITYNKGSAVLRMLADAIEERIFKNGIKIYLNKFSHKNTDQYDLWDAMEESQNKYPSNQVEIVNMMDTWTLQSGYPVITINTSSGEISQKQFLYNDTSESSSLWHIPINVLPASGEIKKVWLKKKSVIMPIFESKEDKLILANVDCKGFYRVNYDLENWARLLNELETNPQNIPLLNRGQLIDDAFNLARAKQVSVSLALNSTRFLHNETDFLPWDSAMRNLHYFVLMFDRSEVYGPMQDYLRNQVTVLYNFFNKINTDNSTVPDDFSSQNSQILAIRVACANGLPECLDMAKDKFHLWMTNETNTIHTNLRSVIYCQAIAAGGQDEWEFAWRRLQSSTNTAEKEQLREALTCTKKVWLLNRYLDYTLDHDKIRLMDVSSVISSIAQNEAGHALAWNFLRANWDYVSQLHGAYLIQEVTSRFSTPFELEELENFEKKYDLGSAALAVRNAIEQTRVNIQWVKEHRETVLDWFQAETS